MVNSKHAFLQALVFTIFIFGIGVFIGFLLENSRESGAALSSVQSELNLLDEQVRNNVINNLGVGCNLAKDNTFEYADRIYEEALQLEKYDSAAKFSDELKTIHKRYDLLRMMLWIQAVEIRKNCSSNFHTVVYFFNYKEEDFGIKSEQLAFSRTLLDLKTENQENILLTPVAVNLDLTSVDLVLDKYDIENVPAVVVDEERVIDRLLTKEEMEKIVFQSNKA